jgi:hypothetical protein
MAGAIMLKIAYDYNVDPFHDDPLVNMAGDAVTVFVQNALPLKWAVDMIPQCKYYDQCLQAYDDGLTME